jgi:hypothetical protein
VAAFFIFGGEADVDVDVNKPNIDVSASTDAT